MKRKNTACCTSAFNLDPMQPFMNCALLGCSTKDLNEFMPLSYYPFMIDYHVEKNRRSPIEMCVLAA